MHIGSRRYDLAQESREVHGLPLVFCSPAFVACFFHPSHDELAEVAGRELAQREYLALGLGPLNKRGQVFAWVGKSLSTSQAGPPGPTRWKKPIELRLAAKRARDGLAHLDIHRCALLPNKLLTAMISKPGRLRQRRRLQKFPPRPPRRRLVSCRLRRCLIHSPRCRLPRRP